MINLALTPYPLSTEWRGENPHPLHLSTGGEGEAGQAYLKFIIETKNKIV